ncbi:MAG TPA: MarR family transcriptional regulator [Chloroflexota bacterium]|nr:MarR family transcriptional regulator [Chloroflexota bacterium]
MDAGEAPLEAGREAVVEEVARLLRDAFPRRSVRSWSKLAVFPPEFTIAQLRAVMVLAHDQPLAVGALGERLGITLSSASRLVDRLVQEGLAERWEDPVDRRRALVQLAPRGQDLIEQMQQGRQERRDRVRRRLRRLPDQKLAALREGLEALAAAARAGEGD